jgi:dihydroxyacid dehydratase/phosphogluconate dehydratase
LASPFLVEYFWYAGGVPALMLELRDLLHLDCITVTGKTLAKTSRRSSATPSLCASGSAT